VVHRFPPDIGERGLEGGALVGRAQVAKPVVAMLQQPGQHLLHARGIVVEVPEDDGHFRGDRVVFLQERKRRAGRFAVEVRGVLEAIGLGTEPGEHGHLARERRAERIDRLHAKPGGTLFQAPAEPVAALQRGRARSQVNALCGARAPGRARVGEGGEDAPAHLGGGLAREGDRGDLLRALDDREQHEALWMRSSVLPEPAGAWTMKDREGSRACRRCSRSGRRAVHSSRSSPDSSDPRAGCRPPGRRAGGRRTCRSRRPAWDRDALRPPRWRGRGHRARVASLRAVASSPRSPRRGAAVLRDELVPGRRFSARARPLNAGLPAFTCAYTTAATSCPPASAYIGSCGCRDGARARRRPCLSRLVVDHRAAAAASGPRDRASRSR